MPGSKDSQKNVEQLSVIHSTRGFNVVRDLCILVKFLFLPIPKHPRNLEYTDLLIWLARLLAYSQKSQITQDTQEQGRP